MRYNLDVVGTIAQYVLALYYLFMTDYLFFDSEWFMGASIVTTLHVCAPDPILRSRQYAITKMLQEQLWTFGQNFTGIIFLLHSQTPSLRKCFIGCVSQGYDYLVIVLNF